MPEIGAVLDRYTIEGELYEALPGKVVRCTACAHRCLIKPGRRGICQVRFNQDGKLFVPHGYVAALQSDPIEKKPLYHFLPGEDALTFGMLGCNFHCAYCQNWITSQAGRDKASESALAYVQKVSPEQMVAYALRTGARVVASSYNEPAITVEWSAAVFRQAHAAGLRCVYISNGYITPAGLQYLKPYLSGYKIDLKTMQGRHYRKLGGVLQNVLDTIQLAHQMDLWVEVVTLVVPGFNDSTDELMDSARFIASVSPDIPWHVTAFHPDYKMDATSRTPAATLLKAAEIGQEAGLNFVYAGNLPGRLQTYERTICPTCQAVLIERSGFRILSNRIEAGACPECRTTIPGVWASAPAQVEGRP